MARHAQHGKSPKIGGPGGGSSLETAHRALMGYYCVAGWRDRAVQQYRRCATALQHELGTEPDALCPTLEVRGAAPNTVAAQSLAPMCAHEHG
jgi:Bacterial transcriptional activator domain